MTENENIKGLDLAEDYFWEICYPELQKHFAQWLPRMAAGLVGEGSECFGFDDLISRDHDFGPSIQIYIPEKDFPLYGKELNTLLSSLPREYHGFPARTKSQYGNGRTGLFSIEGFYNKFLSIHHIPDHYSIWLQMDDISLSTATNGRVFMDNLGEFTKIRKGFLHHYPKDIRLKRMAAECMEIAQSGQYNFSRCVKRKHYVAAHHALDAFITHICSFIYLINKTYKPYYKWEHEGLKKLPVLGQFAFRELQTLSTISLKDNSDHAVFIIENLCKKCIEYLQKQQLTSSGSDFLLDHGPEIMKHISNEKLAHSNPWTLIMT